MFNLTQISYGQYMESRPELTFVAEIEGETPRKDDVIVWNGVTYNTKSIERNYDTDTITVLAERKRDYDEIGRWRG